MTNPNLYTNSPQQVEANKAAQTSMILGIIGIFTVGIILGPLAIMQAKKAERLGAAATVGKVTGWIGLIINILWLILVIFMMIAAVSIGSSTTY